MGLVCAPSRSLVQLLAAAWTVAYQATLRMEFARQKYWNGVPFPEDLPNPDIEPASPALTGVFFTTDTTWEAFIASVRATFPTVEVENFLGKKSHTNG